MSWTLEPSSPTAGRQTRALVRLRDASGRPVRGARLQVEGHMTHPGMAPVIASAAERDAGIYEATIELTMPGNWTMVASGTLPDGRRLTRSLDVRDVR